MLVTAAYARYSSDKQRESSIDDQFRNIERWAHRNQLTINHKFDDKAVSGATSNRSNYQRMLSNAKTGRFQVLVVDSLERLSRDQAELEQTIRLLEFQGIRIIGVSDGYDSNAPKQARKVQRTIKGLMGELYLDDLADKTHRGLKGLALSGKSAGGKSYGYTSSPIEDPSKKDQFGRPEIVGAYKKINPEEAEWVKHIFEQFSEGVNCKQIASDLNEQGIPSPRGGTWGRSTIYGDSKRGLGLLNNPLYIGKFIWNRSQWIKDPDTGKRKRIERPENEWVITDNEELRIIDQATWNKVKTLQKEQESKSINIRKALHNNARTGRGPKYILSGILKCGTCGSNYIIAGKYSYACSKNLNHGQSICSNNIKIAKSLAEKTLLESIRTELWSKKNLKCFIKETQELFNDANNHQTLISQQKALAATQKKIDNIMSAIVQGIVTPTTKAALDEAEAAKVKLEKDIANSDKQNLTTLLPKAEEKYKELIDNLGNEGNIGKIQENIKTLVGNDIILSPVEDSGNHRHLKAELNGNPMGLLAKATGNHGIDVKRQLSVVAGAGFEPTTFGL